MPRRLAAILIADIAGYSRLMHADEERTHVRVSAAINDVVRPSVTRHDGRIVKSIGDGVLAEFSSAVAAVRCAIELQQTMRAEAEHLPLPDQILFRIGIDVGDVIVDEQDIFGDHVNLAARLEQLADPGGIMVSASVHDYVQGRLDCQFEDAGEQRVHNIARPLRVYRVLPGTGQPIANGPVLHLSLFGFVTLSVAGHEIRPRSLKLRAMLGYIALSEALRETRERLVGLLWSESAELQARAVLRQVVRELRDLLGAAGFQGLRLDAHEIGFEPGTLEIDVLAAIKAAEAGEVHQLLLERPRIADDLLAGLEDVDPAFRVWVMAKRQTVRDRLLRALETALDDNRHDPRAKARIAEAVLNLDPTHENACRSLMLLRATAGDIGGALRAYKSLWDVLDEDYGMEPGTATQKLVADIKIGAFEPMAPTSRAPLPASTQRVEARLKLLLRDVASHVIDADKLHLVVGFRQHLIGSLVRFREWQVSDAPFPVSDQPEQASDSYELQINAQQNGETIHLLLMLKELDTKRYIWSDDFELRLENWFEVQRRVVRRVAMALNVYLSVERLQRFSGEPDVSLGIYDRWLRCQALVRTFRAEHWERASRQFREIIDAAPHFVPAYCGLANLQNIRHISFPGTFRTREGERLALEMGQRAAQLDPADVGAQRCLAWAHAMAKQYSQALTHIELACELNPYDSWTLISAALLLVFCGKPEQGLVLAGPPLDIAASPTRSHWAYHFDIQFLTGNYEEALAVETRAQDVLHDTRSAWRAAALAHLGRHSEAQAEAEQFLDGVRANWYGAGPATDEAIVRWLLHLYPISRSEDWERLRDGLRLAGLPTGEAQHHGW